MTLSLNGSTWELLNAFFPATEYFHLSQQQHCFTENHTTKWKERKIFLTRKAFKYKRIAALLLYTPLHCTAEVTRLHKPTKLNQSTFFYFIWLGFQDWGCVVLHAVVILEIWGPCAKYFGHPALAQMNDGNNSFSKNRVCVCSNTGFQWSS